MNIVELLVSEEYSPGSIYTPRATHVKPLQTDVMMTDRVYHY